MKDVHIFIGPTLPLVEAQSIYNCTYHPPVALGDVYRICCDGPRAIAIIDGYFDQVPSVWHKEILYAMSKHIRVFGASSMGAIRAAELAPFGMDGVGQIFKDFASGQLQDDDEVAIIHGPEESGYLVLSDAMVNIRLGLRRSVRDAILTHDTALRLEAMAKSMHYRERSWQAIVEHGREAGVPDATLVALRAYVNNHRPDAKREDAVELLHVLKREEESGFQPREPRFLFERTWNWEQLERVESARLRRNAFERRTGTTMEALKIRLSNSDPDAIRDAVLSVLVCGEARRLGLFERQSSIEDRIRAIVNESIINPTTPDEDLTAIAERDLWLQRLQGHYAKEIEYWLILANYSADQARLNGALSKRPDVGVLPENH